MNIVIVGIGRIGFQIASSLSRKENNVILIDTDEKTLQDAALQLDVAIRRGSGTDWQLLDDLLDMQPDILVSLTGSDETNMVACSLAKHLGFPRTICRVKDNRYLNKSRLDFARLFDVDYFICPELLVAHEIIKQIESASSSNLEYFAHGTVQMRTFTIPENWTHSHQTLQDLPLPEGVMVGLIRRSFDEQGKRFSRNMERVVFPHGKDRIQPSDEVTLIGETQPMKSVHQFLGIDQKEVHSVVLVGGSLIAINLARALVEREIHVRIIEKEFQRCTQLAEILPLCTIMQHDGTDIHFLQSEKIGNADAFVACTGSDEINILSATLARQIGAPNVIAILQSESYKILIDRLGISHVISPYTSAANRVLSLTLSITVSSLTSLYDHAAEIVEISVSPHSKIVGIPLSELGPLLPNEFLFAVIQNRGQIIVAHGNRIISPGDTVVVICHPKHLAELEKIF